jgi:hypothetical protein
MKSPIKMKPGSAMGIQRIARLRCERVRREDVPQRRVIPAGVVEVQPSAASSRWPVKRLTKAS